MFKSRGGAPAVSPRFPPHSPDPTAPSPVDGGQAAPLPVGAPRGPAAAAGLGAGASGVGHGSRRGAPVGGTPGVLQGGGTVGNAAAPATEAELAPRSGPMGAAIGDWGGPAPGSRSAPRSPEKDGRAAAGLLQFHKNIHKYISVSLTGSEAAQAPIKHSHCSARRSRLGSRRRKCIKGGCGSSGSSPQNLCFLRRQARGCCWLPEGCAEHGAESREQPGAGGTAEMPKGRRGRELALSPASSFSSSSSSVRAGSTGGERRPPSPARGVPASAPARRGHVSTRGGSTLTPPPRPR